MGSHPELRYGFDTFGRISSTLEEVEEHVFCAVVNVQIPSICADMTAITLRLPSFVYDSWTHFTVGSQNALFLILTRWPGKLECINKLYASAFTADRLTAVARLALARVKACWLYPRTPPVRRDQIGAIHSIVDM